MHRFAKIPSWVLLASTVLVMGPQSAAPAQSPVAAPQHASSHQDQPHRLLLYNTHTAQRIDIVYRRDGQYVPDALAQLDYFLRDHRTGDVRHFDPRLYDILYDLTSSIGHSGGEIDIVCGYRTSSTNESLRARTTGVAKNSLHIQAEAIDLRMPGHRHVRATQGGSLDASRRSGLLSALGLHPCRRRPRSPMVFRLPGRLDRRRLA